MSYPLHALSSVSSSRTVCTETGFWGLDAAGGALTRPIHRASDTENLLWQGDALKRRPGSFPVGTFPGRINGIYFLGDQQIVHAGEGLYRGNAEGEPILLYSGLRDGPSVGFVRRQTVTHRWCNKYTPDGWWRETRTGDFLFINDGKNYLFYDGESAHSAVDLYWGGALRETLWDGATYSFYADVPIAVTGKLPDGSGGDLHPRGDNLISQFHCESFYVSDEADCSDFVFDVRLADTNPNIPPEIMIRDSEGVWRSYYCVAEDHMWRTDDGRLLLSLPDTPMRGGMPFSYDGNGRIVNLGNGIRRVANDGMDNVRITVAVYKDPPDLVQTATVQGFFGPDGTDRVLFLGGSAAAPGVDTFSAPDNYFCFYATSVERLGDERAPITGYCLLTDGRMAVLKDDPRGANVYFRSHTVVSMGQTLSGEPYQLDAYPSRMGAAVEGCVSCHTVGISGNEPVFLGKAGLYSVRSVSNELTNLNETVRRSGSIDPLLRAQSVAEARSVCWQGYYLLTFGDIGFITDGRRDSAGALRFLKWRFSSPITALGKTENGLYWGDGEGNVRRLAEEGEIPAFQPEAYWHCALPADNGGRRQNLKQLSALLCPAHGGKVRLRLFREQTPATDRSMAVQRLDFADWDFAAVSFDGSTAPRWMALPAVTGIGDGFEVRLYLDAGAELLLWGLRMIYEKGGTVR